MGEMVSEIAGVLGVVRGIGRMDCAYCVLFGGEMRDMNEKPLEDRETVSSYGLLYIIRAYNRGDISFEEWLSQSREWAEQIISQSEQYKEGAV